MSEPILLIPGLNCSARLYTPQLPMLWSRAPVMIADHRGASSIEDLAEQILAVAPPRFALAGFSMGGFISFEILRRCPGRVSRLALLSTSAVPEDLAGRGAVLREERIALAEAGRFDEIAPLHYANNVHPSRQSDAALRATHAAMTEEVGPQGYIRQQRAIGSRPDARDLLRSINCPTLIAVGDSDVLTPPARAQEMHAAIGGSRLVVASDCGHLSPLEQPAVILQALQAWLDS